MIKVSVFRNYYFVVRGNTVAVSLRTIPIYILGKKARGFISRRWVLAQVAGL